MLSKKDWDELQQLSYSVMPKWWYNKEDCDKQYQAYVEGCQQFKLKQKIEVRWGDPTVDME